MHVCSPGQGSITQSLNPLQLGEIILCRPSHCVLPGNISDCCSVPYRPLTATSVVKDKHQDSHSKTDTVQVRHFNFRSTQIHKSNIKSICIQIETKKQTNKQTYTSDLVKRSRSPNQYAHVKLGRLFTVTQLQAVAKKNSMKYYSRKRQHYRGFSQRKENA